VPGQTLVVDGQVLDVQAHANKKILFLTMSGTAGVTPTFFVEDAPADFTVEKLTAFQGKQVRISGQRSDFRGTAQLVVSELSDITVIP
jgi:DNA/RNA endonuclease YhcR with UshA esterase domain